MKTNDRARAGFAKRFDTESTGETIQGAVVLQRIMGGLDAWDRKTVAARYQIRNELTNELAPPTAFEDQWCVLTDRRVLLVQKKSLAVNQTGGKLQHELDRATVRLGWANYESGGKRLRLMHLSTTDGRHNVQHTVLGSVIRQSNKYDEADLMIDALGDQAYQIEDLNEHPGGPPRTTP